MNNLSIRTKLLSGFGIVLLLLCAVGLTGLYCLRQAGNMSNETDKQLQIEIDAEKINGYVTQTRSEALRGMYAKDIRPVFKADNTPDKLDKNYRKTYRYFLDDRLDEILAAVEETIDHLVERLDPANEQDKGDIDLCEQVKKDFQAYSDLTTQWADIQDKIHESAVLRVQLADGVQNSIKSIVNRTDENIVKEERIIQIDGKDELYTHKRLAIRQRELGDLLERVELCRRLTREQITKTDPTEIERFNGFVLDTFNEMSETINLVLPQFRTAANAEDAEEGLGFFEKWQAEVLKCTDLVNDQQSTFEQYIGTAQSIVANMEIILRHAEETANKAQTDLNDMIARAFTIIISTIILAVIVGLCAGLFMTQNITRGIGSTVACMNQIADEGDLSFEISKKDLQRQDEIGILSCALESILREFRNVEKLATELASGNWRVTVKSRGEKDAMNINLARMLDQVNGVLNEINSDVQKVNTGAGEVSSAAQTLSSGAQESAASLEEITASMSEISSQTKANAQSATEARDLAQKATDAASAGQKAMQTMNEAMDRITNNSSEIQKVIKVIDDIAFQTNLLALNAAVEAARAGVHGKGFAVVAEEVRNLAARSAKAAHETTELISKSGQEITRGDEIAVQTGEVLNAIVDQIRQTTDLVAGIAVASNEQAQGVAQITIGLQQIDAVTQQNTAAAEESASAAGEMSGMANELQTLVAGFKLR